YVLVEEIGRGKTAKVHRAWDRKNDSEVAVKLPIVPECLLAKEIFENEGNALGQVRHPNIVQIIEHGESEFGRFIVMELVKGRCLNDIMARRMLSLKKRLMVLADLCNALAAMHEAGIVHRDVKPKNIIVCEDERAKLLDFGYANVRSGFSCKHLTRERFGSPFYSAPELTINSGDPRLDVYSLGIMMYEMLLKNAPLRVMIAIRLLEIQHSFKHLKRQVFTGRISQLAGEIIEAAVHKDPLKRYNSAAAMGETLQMLLRNIE
ncbi:serine/threonine protein kinase, partial [Candidatus Micrarchaeota archaeon]|nr:serine/threonine protein kinase [Candidatus Micrarchaeota archaeon]